MRAAYGAGTAETAAVAVVESGAGAEAGAGSGAAAAAVCHTSGLAVAAEYHPSQSAAPGKTAGQEPGLAGGRAKTYGVDVCQRLGQVFGRVLDQEEAGSANYQEMVAAAAGTEAEHSAQVEQPAHVEPAGTLEWHLVKVGHTWTFSVVGREAAAVAEY